MVRVRAKYKKSVPLVHCPPSRPLLTCPGKKPPGVPSVVLRIIFVPYFFYYRAAASTTYRNKCAIDMTSDIRTLLHDSSSP